MINFLPQKSGMLLTDRLLRKYFTGTDIAEGYLIICSNSTCFTDARYFYQAKDKLAKVGVGAKLYSGLGDIKEFLKSNGIKKLYLDYDTTTLTDFERYRQLKVKLLNGKEFIIKKRAIKEEFELESVKKACEIIQRAFYNTLEYVKVGITELQLKNALENEMLKLGAEGPAFDTIVAFGSNGTVPHHETGDTPLTDNTAILIDTGCKVNGYCSDLTRTVFFGEPSEKFIRCYDAVLNANLIALENIKVGDKTCVADAFARDYLKSQNLAEYFTHSLGHGVGLEIHEFPTLSPRTSDTLTENMVFTVEPGVYIDGELGIRLEDTVAIKGGKAVRLYDDDKKLIKIKK